jgi:hypothetical protein
MTTTRWRRRAGTAAMVAMAISLSPFGDRAVAEDVGADRNWAASARGSGLEAIIKTTGGFIVDRIDPSGSLAISSIDTGLQQSASLAASPYPSEVGNQGPGLVLGVIANTVPFVSQIDLPDLPQAPSVPTVVRSSADGLDPPSAHVDGAGALQLDVESTARKSTASAGLGGSAPGLVRVGRVESSSVVDASKPNEVVARGISSTYGIQIAGVLSIAEARSEVVVRRHGDAPPEITVTHQVFGATLGGLAVEITPGGLKVAGTEVPVPLPVLAPLDQANVGIRLGQVDKLNGGAYVSALTVSVPFDVPEASIPVSVPRQVVLDLSFGVASATAFDLGEAIGSTGTGGSVAADLGQATDLTAPVADATGSFGDLADLGGTGLAPVIPNRRIGSAPAVPVALAPAALTSVDESFGGLGWVAILAAALFIPLLLLGRTRREDSLS